MTPIRIQDVSKHFGATVAVDRVTLEIGGGELFFLLGPSGCGKTTLLRMLAGFVPPDAGQIYFGEECITNLPPRRRDAGMVFQTYALWPHMTVADNVAYGLRVRRLPRAEVAQRVQRVLQLVRMDGLESRRPNELSGGQQQRVALARALVVEPRVLLLDEPLSNLDARLRDEMRGEIRRLHRETGLTMVYVTHDQKEALTLADRLAVMERGRLVQLGQPQEVYDRPATRFVAGFLGDSNFLPGTVRDLGPSGCAVDTALGLILGVAGKSSFLERSSVVCSIRPHALLLDSAATVVNRFSARVEQVAFSGELLRLTVRAAKNVELQVTTLPQVGGRLREGDTINLSVPAQQVVILQDSN